MGELRQRGRVWWIRYYRNGQRYEESSGSAKKGEAVTLLKLREGDGAHGIPVMPKIGRLRFEEAAADVVIDYRVNGKRSLKVLKATSEIAADLYLELAAIDAVLPGGVTKVSAPDVVVYDRGASEDARAETRVRLAQEAYANYRAQGGLK